MRFVPLLVGLGDPAERLTHQSAARVKRRCHHIRIMSSAVDFTAREVFQRIGWFTSAQGRPRGFYGNALFLRLGLVVNGRVDERWGHYWFTLIHGRSFTHHTRFVSDRSGGVRRLRPQKAYAMSDFLKVTMPWRRPSGSVMMAPVRLRPPWRFFVSLQSCVIGKVTFLGHSPGCWRTAGTLHFRHFCPPFRPSGAH